MRFIRGFSNAARASINNATLSIADTLTHEDSLDRARGLLFNATRALHPGKSTDDSLVIVQVCACMLVVLFLREHPTLCTCACCSLLSVRDPRLHRQMTTSGPKSTRHP